MEGYPMHRAFLVAALLVLPAALALAPPTQAIDCTGTSTGLVPLTDLGAGTYQGAQGGLYPDGSNERPAAHTALGEALASLVVPRNHAGLPDPATGRIVFLSIGMSNTNQEFGRFVQLASSDPGRHPSVVVFNGAQGGVPAEDMAPLDSPYWQNLLDRLANAGLGAAQVQAVWLKQANRAPRGDFPDQPQALQDDLRSIAQNLKVVFPNLWLVYLSSRIYAGYATTQLNPEPHAYESGFSVRWLVEEQLGSPVPFLTPGRPADPQPALLPWLSWGPYLWADGLTPRGGDALTYECGDFAQDGTHPALGARDKVAGMLLDFVHTDPTAKVWYEQGGGGLLPSLP